MGRTSQRHLISLIIFSANKNSLSHFSDLMDRARTSTASVSFVSRAVVSVSFQKCADILRKKLTSWLMAQSIDGDYKDYNHRLQLPFDANFEDSLSPIMRLVSGYLSLPAKIHALLFNRKSSNERPIEIRESFDITEDTTTYRNERIM